MDQEQYKIVNVECVLRRNPGNKQKFDIWEETHYPNRTVRQMLVQNLTFDMASKTCETFNKPIPF